MLESDESPAWASSLAHRAMQQQVPLIIGDTARDAAIAATMPQGLRAALCVPLFVGDGPPQGALTVVTGEPSAFSSNGACSKQLCAISTMGWWWSMRIRRSCWLIRSVAR